MIYRTLIGFSICFTLIGCGGSSDDTPPELNEMTMALTPLSKHAATTFDNHLKNGLYLRSSEGLVMTLEASSAISDRNTANLKEFSNTTLQTQGVDEGDRIKYDGEFLFIAKNNDSQYRIYSDGEQDTSASQYQASIRIMKRNTNGEIAEIADVTVNEQAHSINSIYLQEGNLAVISNIDSYSSPSSADASLMTEPLLPIAQQFNLSVFDVENPEETKIKTSLTIDGHIIDSRRVENTLYLISSYTPSVDGIVYASSLEDKKNNYNIIKNLDISQLMPSYQDTLGNTFPLVSEEVCYIPEDATHKDGFDRIVTLTAIDITTAQPLNSVCVNTDVDGIYATANSAYLYGTDYQYHEAQSAETSIIHKFSLDNLSIQYAASGTLDGRFNWNMSNLRFSEQHPYLRVVTTSGNQSTGYQHRVNILAQEENQLSLVSQLPNENKSKVIGKTSANGLVEEDIKAVRFYGNTAFIVTFLTTDPLYVIDLTDHANPSITGELEIPGYSAYLHPLSDSLLLGIGQNIDDRMTVLEQGVNTTDSVDFAPVIEGAKVTLFDVSELESPREISSIVFDSGYTPVEHNYHALTYLPMSDGSFRFALPIESWQFTTVTEQQQKIDIWSPLNFLALLEVTGSDRNATLVSKGTINAKQSETSYYGTAWDDRSVFHHDDIYYIHSNKVWHSHWSNTETITGPF